MGRKLIKRCLLVMLSVALLFGVGMKPIAAGTTVTADNVKLTDLFWGYPSYLNIQNHILSNAISTGKGVLDNLSTEEERIIRAQSVLKNHTDIVYLSSFFTEIFGFDSQLQHKCDAKAAELLLKATAYEPTVVGTIEKHVKELAKDMETGGKEVTAIVNVIKNYWIATHEFTNEQLEAFNEKVKEQTGLINTIAKTTGIAMDVVEIVDFIFFCEALNDEILDYIFEHGGTELKRAINNYRSYRDNDYVTYVANKYLTEDVLPKIFDVKAAISKMNLSDGAVFAICEFFLAKIADGMGMVTELGNAEDYLVACSLYSYTLEMQTAAANLRSEIITTPIVSDDVLKYEMGYGVYVASVKAFAESIKSVDQDSATKTAMDSVIASIENHGTYEKQIERCMESLKSDLANGTAKERIIDSEKTYVVTSDTEIKPPSDIIDSDTIYVSNGKIFCGLNIRSGANITLSETDVKINGNVCMEDDSDDVTSFTIEEMASANIAGNLITERDSSGIFKQILVTVRGGLKIDGNMENIGVLLGTTKIEGENAYFEVAGDAQCGGSMTGGTAVFKGALEGGYYELGSGKVILETPAGSSAQMGTFNLEVPESGEDLGKAGIEIIQNGEESYEFSGSAPSHAITIKNDSYQQSGELEIQGIRISSSSSKNAPKLITSGKVTVNGDVSLHACSDGATGLTVEEGSEIEIGGDLISERTSIADKVPEFIIKGRFYTKFFIIRIFSEKY